MQRKNVTATILGLAIWLMAFMANAQYSTGQLVRLPANLQENEAAVWIVVSPQGLDTERLADKLIFAAPCQPTVVHIEFIGITVKDNAPIVRQVTHRLTIGMPTPTPVDPPPPVVVDPPTSPPPASFPDLLKAVQNHPADTVAQIAITSNLTTIIKRITDKEFNTVTDAMIATRALLQTALPATSRQKWESWRSAVGIELGKIPINTPNELVGPLQVIIQGLK